LYSSNPPAIPPALERVVQQIQHKFGHRSVQTARDIHALPQVIPTGYAGLDTLIRGIPQGYLSILQGMPTSGIHTLGHHLIAQAQQHHMGVLYVDMTNTLDGESASLQGVSLDDLVLVESDDAQLVLSLIRTVLHLHILGLVVVHLRPNITQLNLHALLPLLHQSGSALVFVTARQPEIEGTALHIHAQREKWLRHEDDIIGCLSRITLQKHRWGYEGQDVCLLMPLEAEAWR
jgi:hypothetical protein